MARRVQQLCLMSCFGLGLIVVPSSGRTLSAQTPAPQAPPTQAPPAQTSTPPQTQPPQTQTPPAGDFKPVFGQAGKDVVWVPSPPEMVEKMLDLAGVTASDFVMDLGSGDGRNIIAAAKRGARGIGVEFNTEMVALSRRIAAQEGVSEMAQFVEGDMFEADVSRATVLALFLLTDNLRRLRPKLFDLKAGTRIVINTFSIPEWEPDARETVTGDCTSWCTVLLWIVPAKVQGTWRLPQSELTLWQQFQLVTGTLTTDGRAIPIDEGRLHGEEITFRVSGKSYRARVTGDTMTGSVEAIGAAAAGGGAGATGATRAAGAKGAATAGAGSTWTATRTPPAEAQRPD